MAGMILLHLDTKGPEIQHPALPGLGTHHVSGGDWTNPRLLHPRGGSNVFATNPGRQRSLHPFPPAAFCLL